MSLSQLCNGVEALLGFKYLLMPIIVTWQEDGKHKTDLTAK